MRFVIALLVLSFVYSPRSEAETDLACLFPLFLPFCAIADSMRNSRNREAYEEAQRKAAEGAQKFNTCVQELAPEGLPVTSNLACGYAGGDVAKARELLRTLPCDNSSVAQSLGGRRAGYMFEHCKGTSAESERYYISIDQQYKDAFASCRLKHDNLDCQRIVGYHPTVDLEKEVEGVCRASTPTDETVIKERVDCEVKGGQRSDCHRVAESIGYQRCVKQIRKSYKNYAPRS